MTREKVSILLPLTDDGQELAAYTYNADGTPRTVTHGPIRQEYTYDLDKNLTGLTVRSGDGLLSQDSYAYDGNGNRIRKQALEGTTLYQYDALNQLQRVDYPAYSEELFYDKAGNRARRLLDGEEELYQYDPRNRLMALTRGGVTTPFQYDRAGNLLRDDKAKYTYDAFNRTVKVETFDGNVQVNRYDAEGLRHEMEENGRLVRFIFHKGEAVAEQEENSNVIRLIRGSELIARSSDSESARTYYHYASDEMGSTTHIVDENGNVKNRYEYDAWGRITVKEEAVPNRFTYYGQQIDPITQQYYLRARFYNPVIGRFIQEDTYRGDGLNLYAYCANNPILYTDPSGNAPSTPVDPNRFNYLIQNGSQEEIFAELWRVRTEMFDKALRENPYIDSLGLRENELLVGTYRELSSGSTIFRKVVTDAQGLPFIKEIIASLKNDEITPHHMPRANDLKKIPYRSGSCLNITAGVHKYTFTFGRMTKQADALYKALTYENRLLFDQSIGVQGVQTRLKRNVRFESK